MVEVGACARATRLREQVGIIKVGRYRIILPTLNCKVCGADFKPIPRTGHARYNPNIVTCEAHRGCKNYGRDCGKCYKRREEGVSRLRKSERIIDEARWFQISLEEERTAEDFTPYLKEMGIIK